MTHPIKNASKKNQYPNSWKGIIMTDELFRLLQIAIDIIPALQKTIATLPPEDTKQVKPDDAIKDDDTAFIDITTTRLLLQEIHALSKTTHTISSINQAISILISLSSSSSQDDTQQQQQPVMQYITPATLRAMETIFDYHDRMIHTTTTTTTTIQTNESSSSSSSSVERQDNLLPSSSSSSLSKALQDALQPTQFTDTPFVYSHSIITPHNDDDTNTDTQNRHMTKQQMKFQLRMQKLRWKQEEYKYRTITNNIGNNMNNNNNDDPITAKSMTYAASIGLNMIVAPISFGVFMYFFAGSMMDYIWPVVVVPHPHQQQPQQVDIKKVIVGVISGVLMLFVEMLLFVIRTHTVDSVILQKKKSKQRRNNNVQPTPNPFGYYTSQTTKSYTD